MLVRLTPARYVSTDLASEGGGVYGMTWTYPIAKVERNGTVLTETSTNPPGTNDYWYHDESSGTFKVKLASAPSSTNVVVIYYYLFYTNQKAREAYETPTDSATTLRDWEPRLAYLPTITQSIRNVTSGVFSLSASGLELINSDYAFQSFLTSKDSFSGKDVDIWLCVNDTSEIQKVFKGAVDSIRLSEGTVSVSFLDLFSKLDKPCYMGDTAAEAIYSRDTFTSLDTAYEGVPCKYVAGAGNRITFKYVQSTGGGADVDGRPVDGEQAACTSFTYVSTSTNRTWGLCRVPTGIANQSFGSIVRKLDGLGSSITLAYVNSHTYAVGETIKWVEAAVTYYGIVIRADAFTYSGTAYNLAISTADGTFTTSSTINALPKIAIGIRGGSLQYGIWVKYSDFTTNSSTTSGANKYISVTFADNFESTYLSAADVTTLDPGVYQVLFRVVPSADAGHETVLKAIIDSAGVTSNAASFTAAGSALAMDCRFTIPYFDETDYKTHTEYAEDLLACTLGAVYQNSSQEAAYELLDSEAGAQTIDRNVYLKGSLSASVDYNDVVTQIVAYNPHAIELDSLDSADPSSVTSESLIAKYLHGAKTTRFRHLMVSLANRIAAVLAVRSSPRILYRFETATASLSSLLNDPITLEASAVLGGSGTKDLSIVTIDNSGSSTVVEALDLESLA
jgi:hypothetical protein